MKLIKPEEMLMGAEVRTLALFVRYKLAKAERKNKSLNVQGQDDASDCAEYVQKV